MPSMMTNNQDPHGIANDTKQKVVWETMEVDASKVTLPEGKRLGPLRRI